MTIRTKEVVADIKVERLHADAILPEYLTPGSSGADLHALSADVIPAGGRVLVDTGIAIQIPFGYEGQVRPRSGLAIKHGVTVLNAPGTIDSDYRGPLKVILFNSSDLPFSIAAGDRIAQLVIAPVVRGEFVDGDLDDTERGAGGFGSTGVGSRAVTLTEVASALGELDDDEEEASLDVTPNGYQGDEED